MVDDAERLALGGKETAIDGSERIFCLRDLGCGLEFSADGGLVDYREGVGPGVEAEVGEGDPSDFCFVGAQGVKGSAGGEDSFDGEGFGVTGILFGADGSGGGGDDFGRGLLSLRGTRYHRQCEPGEEKKSHDGSKERLSG